MDVKLWLESALADENLAEFTVKLTGTTEKGDGYSSAIAFAEVEGKTKNGASKTYNLALKHSKNNEVLRQQVPSKQAFETEIYFYDKVLPAFRKFQEAKGIDNMFTSVPRYYGGFMGDKNEVVVLGDLKKAGYKLHDKSEPLSRNLLEHVVEQYAKLHAISTAFGDQKPQEFRTLTSEIPDMFATFSKYMDVTLFFKPVMEEAYNLLKDELTEDARNKWLNLIDRIKFVLLDIFRDDPCFKVVSHGDSWNNNLLFKHETDQSLPPEVVILDWQTLSMFPPVRDLSYFLYSCISKEDLEDFDCILAYYYQHFSNCVRKLGSDPEKIYPFAQLLADWKKFSCHSFIYAPLFAKLAATDKSEVRDFDEIAAEGKDMNELFQYKLRNEEKFKGRMKMLIEHAVERQFI